MFARSVGAAAGGSPGSSGLPCAVRLRWSAVRTLSRAFSRFWGLSRTGCSRFGPGRVFSFSRTPWLPARSLGRPRWSGSCFALGSSAVFSVSLAAPVSQWQAVVLSAGNPVIGIAFLLWVFSPHGPRSRARWCSPGSSPDRCSSLLPVCKRGVRGQGRRVGSSRSGRCASPGRAGRGGSALSTRQVRSAIIGFVGPVPARPGRPRRVGLRALGLARGSAIRGRRRSIRTRIRLLFQAWGIGGFHRPALRPAGMLFGRCRAPRCRTVRSAAAAGQASPPEACRLRRVPRSASPGDTPARLPDGAGTRAANAARSTPLAPPGSSRPASLLSRPRPVGSS